MAGKRRDTIAFTVVVTVLVVLGAAGMLLVLALSGAPRTLVLATVLATIPVGPLIVCYMWLDRYEPEPRRLLAAGLLWGGFVATGVAILLLCWYPFLRITWLPHGAPLKPGDVVLAAETLAAGIG